MPNPGHPFDSELPELLDQVDQLDEDELLGGGPVAATGEHLGDLSPEEIPF